MTKLATIAQPLVRHRSVLLGALLIGAVGIVPTDQLVLQLKTARPISPQEASDAGRLWQHLRTQNAPLRVVTPTGVS